MAEQFLPERLAVCPFCGKDLFVKLGFWQCEGHYRYRRYWNVGNRVEQGFEQFGYRYSIFHLMLAEKQYIDAEMFCMKENPPGVVLAVHLWKKKDLESAPTFEEIVWELERMAKLSCMSDS